MIDIELIGTLQLAWTFKASWRDVPLIKWKVLLVEMTDEPVQQYKRRSLRAPIIVTRVKVDQDGKVFFGYAKNLSKAGIFIQTINPKSVGEKFNVEFILPGEDEMISCTVEVIWKRDYPQSQKHEPGMGLKFLDLSPEQAEIIDAWVDKDAESSEYII